MKQQWLEKQLNDIRGVQAAYEAEMRRIVLKRRQAWHLDDAEGITASEDATVSALSVFHRDVKAILDRD